MFRHLISYIKYRTLRRKICLLYHSVHNKSHTGCPERRPKTSGREEQKFLPPERPFCAANYIFTALGRQNTALLRIKGTFETPGVEIYVTCNNARKRENSTEYRELLAARMETTKLTLSKTHTNQSRRW